MSKKKKYDIEVMFSTYVYVTVYADDVDDALSIAEDEATEKFRHDLDNGYYGVSDFDCKAQ